MLKETYYTLYYIVRRTYFVYAPVVDRISHFTSYTIQFQKKKINQFYTPVNFRVNFSIAEM